MKSPFEPGPARQKIKAATSTHRPSNQCHCHPPLTPPPTAHCTTKQQHPVHHLDPAWFAILGAALLCVAAAPMEVDEVMHSVEWDMLLFFAAQFVMVEVRCDGHRGACVCVFAFALGFGGDIQER